MDITSLRINEERLWRMLMRSSEIGRSESDGLRRLALSDSDKAMRDQFVSWCRESGCEVATDQAGNIFGRLTGQEDLPPVGVGSHLDTAAVGGRFDGILGVLSGLEIVRTLRDNRINPKRPIEVICWTNEEGTRFPCYLSGSLVFTGQMSLDSLYALTDDDKKGFGEELHRIGYAGDIPVGAHRLDSYFELHIEQGPILYEANVPVGVVIAGAAVRGAYVIFRGEAAHPGGTPMRLRKNALVGAANFIAAVNNIGWKFAPMGRTTTTRISVWPNKNGTIPSYAEVMVDIRHQDTNELEHMYSEAMAAVHGCANEASVECEVRGEWHFGGADVVFSQECITCIRSAAMALNCPTMDIYSQAGHDAYSVSRVAPTAMIFCPCVNGLSHSEAEEIIPEQTWPSVNVLLQAVLARANR